MKKKPIIFSFLSLATLWIVWTCTRPIPQFEQIEPHASSSETSPIQRVASKKHENIASNPSAISAEHPMILTSEQFNETAREVMSSIPTLEDLQKLSAEQVHFTPEPLIQAGFQLGRIAQILHDNPSLAHEGIEFYKNCAHSHQFPTSVRALCYSDLLHMNSNAEESSLPEEVKKLAAQLR